MLVCIIQLFAYSTIMELITTQKPKKVVNPYYGMATIL